MHSDTTDPASAYLRQIMAAVATPGAALPGIEFREPGSLPSIFTVTDLAAASIAAAAASLARFASVRSGRPPSVCIDRRLASFWFAYSLRPRGWSLATPWNRIAGDYQAADGWIRLHTNAPHHLAAALAVLGAPANKEAVARAVAQWECFKLETAIVQNKGCAAVMRTLDDWRVHPQGQAAAAEPLLHRSVTASGARPSWPIPPARPLAGIRVLDLTRVLAGPTATRFLAGFGANVLRIDPPTWDEPNVVQEMTLGKRCARLDLHTSEDRAVLERLIAGADVLVHGYRSDALAGLGINATRRRELNPGLVDVSLDAYGWSGPWQGRRGFDSLVQMSSGIADAGMRRLGRDHPTPLPVQALDYATGYLMAAAAIQGLIERMTTGAGSEVRASLARTAALLIDGPPQPSGEAGLAPETPDDLADGPDEITYWGPARRIKAPAIIEGIPIRWDRAAGPLGSAPAAW